MGENLKKRGVLKIPSLFKNNSKEKTNLFEENQRLKQLILGMKEQEIRNYSNSQKKIDFSQPLILCDVVGIHNQRALIKLPNGNVFFVGMVPNLLGKLKINDKVLAEQKSLTIVNKIKYNSKQFGVENFVIMEKPKVSWESIGGMEDKVREIKEVIELPLKNPKIFDKVGIEPPKGILLYGPSGTGKTLLAKAVASSTNSTFIEIVGSELVQKFIGEGAKLVKEIFKLAAEKAPSIIFIDELDSIAAERMELGTSGEREVQRTFMQLLSEIDGFDPLDNVKIIGATNRIDILDRAILRPGRLDRLLEIPLPDETSREKIIKIHSKKMKLSNVDFERLVKLTNGFTGAEIRSVCTESGYFAIRENRIKVKMEDFVNAIEKVNQEETKEHVAMFG